VNYLKYIVHGGQTAAELKKKHYAPLPSTVDTLAKAGVTTTNIED
jgi:hypothetical protein